MIQRVCYISMAVADRNRCSVEYVVAYTHHIITRESQIALSWQVCAFFFFIFFFSFYYTIEQIFPFWQFSSPQFRGNMDMRASTFRQVHILSGFFSFIWLYGFFSYWYVHYSQVESIEVHALVGTSRCLTYQTEKVHEASHSLGRC